MKRKILQYTGAMDRAGAETLLMNIYRNINREEFEFHFISHTKDKCDYDNEIEKLGGKIIYLERVSLKNIFKYKKDFQKIVDIYGPYDAIHTHMQLMNGLILKVAKKCGIKKRISHAHLNGDYSKKKFIRNIYVNLSKTLIRKNSTYKIACSQNAGKYLYENKDFLLLNNAVDLNQFEEKVKYKEYLNQKLNLDKNIKKITHVGRFVEAKNHKFIIEVFSKLIEKDNNYRLFLCGDGYLKEEIEEKVKGLKLDKYIFFLGVRDDINKILLSTDIFFMPSILEGLPVALVEAQAARCKCVISSNIPDEGDIGLNLIEKISLENSNSEWVDELQKNQILNCNFQDIKVAMVKNGYSLEGNVKMLSEFYKE